jgi:diguanylate cyclase (GGDEF)-like protein
MINSFSCGLFISNINERHIEYVNDNICRTLLYEESDLIGLDVNEIFTKASLIFLESYVYPTLLKEHELTEIQLTILTKERDRLPIVANINIQDNIIFWSIFTAVKRDKLYQELLDVRDKLEYQAEKLELAATTDYLTHLLNRRSIIEKTESLIKNAPRKSPALSLAMIDIDFFKQINDQHGHVKGDEILIEVGKALNQVCLKQDLAARWGGEEFLVVFYGPTFEETKHLCQKIHKKIHEIKLSDQPLTVSIGVVTYHLDHHTNTTLDDIIEEADQLMYQAKNNGRNQTRSRQILNVKSAKNTLAL